MTCEDDVLDPHDDEGHGLKIDPSNGEVFQRYLARLRGLQFLSTVFNDLGKLATFPQCDYKMSKELHLEQT